MASAVTPLLSICIPTYNRSELLDVCLASILPQIQRWGEMVEVVISDDASNDGTEALLDRYAQHYHFRRHRHAQNVGLVGNVTFVAGKLARGEFVWLLGDDDLLAVGAIDQVVERLQNMPEVDLLALNVGYYPFENRPSVAEATGGIRAGSESQLRNKGLQGMLPFEQLLQGPCADFTAMYSSIMRRTYWTAGFPEPLSGEPFTSARNSYPNAWLIAQNMPGKQAAALRDPLVCIYAMQAEQFSWASYHPRTVVLHLTELLKLFEANGVPHRVLEPYYLYQLNHRGTDLGNLCWDRRSLGGWREACRFAWLLRRHPLRLLKVFVVSCSNAHAPAMLRRPVQWWMRRRVAQSRK
ncbi:MAG: glycosyltransferase family 2 protein [Aureliella sp.]